MAARLHINISQGLFEVEGEEDFVREMYDNFKAELANKPVQQTEGASKAKAPKKKAPASPKSSNGSAKKKKKKTESLKVDKTLDLSGIGGAMSLDNFNAKYLPKSNLKRNVVYVEYLKEEMGFDAVTIFQVWTCYHHMKLKLPTDMKSSLKDTGKDSHGARLDAQDLDDLTVSVQGKNWLLKQANNAKNSTS